MAKNKPKILLTNDDGIDSPGLWAAAEALSDIGYVWVVAPREQASGMGHSMPSTSDGIITPKKLEVHGKEWTTYAVGGTPAQTVQHGILEIMKENPDLVVSGINYGLNLGMAITVSGTVGAAMEGAAHGIRSMAVSLETQKELHLTHSTDVDFSAAAYFTKYFAKSMLENPLDENVQIVKVDIPCDATSETSWHVTRLARVRYYIPMTRNRTDWSKPGPIDYILQEDISLFPQDTDVYAVLGKRMVSITPLNMDMTAGIDFDQLDRTIRP